ncbi:putative protein phosphatase 2C 65 [Salvia divinorum]|uniref:PPM-type phosphatase domain-containing protein n=1 Tax=Salvia divinorum TaxID=28513 RepID=A0ABD1GHN7_SALDI
MGACCSCHRVGRFEGCPIEEEAKPREVDDDNIILTGEGGARVRLQGSSKYVAMHTQQGKKGYNQDAMTVWENFSGDKEAVLCSIFDGHGPNGHMVSRYVRDYLPAKVTKCYQQSRSYKMDPESDQVCDENHPYNLFWKEKLVKCFHEMDEELESDAPVDSYSSGTTSVTVLKKGRNLVVANLGDSRAVLCTRDSNNELVAQQLTVDLKPNLPAEKARITSHRGRVLPMKEEPNVHRIWMPDQDCPGLAMARAFGDFCLKDYGLISTPEITYRRLSDRDEFVVLATDGIWDVLSNSDVIKIVSSARKRSMAAKLLIDEAQRAWRHKFPCAKTDDCAAICLFFKRPRPLLTKSISEVTHLSLNYKDHAANNGGHDHELETVLNCDMEEGIDDSHKAAGKNTQRRRRKTSRKIEFAGQ